MRAVNLIPEDYRRGGPRRSPALIAGTLGPAHFLVALLVIVVGIVLLRVLAANDVNDKHATLTALQSQVATEQAQAAKLSAYISFVQSAQQREAQVRAIAVERFPWSRAFNQISHVLPASTSLTAITATSGTGAATAPAPGAAGVLAAGPTFNLTGCADTANQNGVATVLRRLTHLTGVSNVGFQNSTRASGCGNSFSLTLSFANPGAPLPAGPTTSATPPATTSTTTTPLVTTSGATAPLAAPTTSATTTTGAGG